jgi:hypothetical protein
MKTAVDVKEKQMRCSRRAWLLTIAALLSGVLVAGCGAGSASPMGAASTPASAASVVESGVAFARCIRAHGVPNFPDPKVSGQQVRMAPASAVQAPAFQSAAHSCQRLLPKGPPSSEAPSPQAQAQMLATSACMRKHGIPDFPDPSTSPPSSSAGYSGIMGGGGYYLAIPKAIDPSSPAFERAAATCNFGRGR